MKRFSPRIWAIALTAVFALQSTTSVFAATLDPSLESLPESSSSEWVEASEEVLESEQPEESQEGLESSAPETSAPQVIQKTPDVSQPDVSQPDVSQPEVSQPEVSESEKSQTPAAEPLEKPEEVAVLVVPGVPDTPADDGVTFYFQPVALADSYIVTLEDASVEPVLVETKIVSATDLETTEIDGKKLTQLNWNGLDLDPQKNYTLKLQAADSTNANAASDAVMAQVKAVAAPQDLQIVQNLASNDFTISWTEDVNTQLQYRILKDGIVLASQPSITAAEGKNSCTVTEAGNYAVQVVEQQQNELLYGAAATAVITVPQAPQGLTAVAGNQKVTLSWTASTEPDASTVIYRDGVEVETVTESTYEDAELTNGTEYAYTLRTVIGTGAEARYSEATEELKVIPARMDLEAPTLEVIEQKDLALVLNWNAVDADQYLIYRSETTPIVLEETNLLATVEKEVLTYTDTTAQVNRDYYYMVVAKRADETSKASETLSAQVKFAAPTGVSAKGGDTQVTLKWKANPMAKSYVISANGKKYVTKGTSYTVKGLPNNKTYSITVAACTTADGKGTCSSATKVSVKTAIKAPATPKNFKVKQGNLKMNVSWSASSGATAYEVFRYKTAVKKYVKVATVKTTSWTDKNIKSTSDYRYRVRAVRTAGGKTAYSGYTNTLIYKGVKTVGKVTGLSAKAGENKVELKWRKVSKADGYYVYRQNTKTKKYEKIGSTKTALSYKNTSVTNGTKYSYKVIAYENQKQRVIKNSPTIKVFSESYSSVVSATPKALIPSKTSGLKATQASQTKVTLKWSATKNATGYRVYRYNDSKKKYEVLRDTASLTTSDSKGIQLGKTYKYCVKAYRVVKNVRYYSPSASSAVSIKIQKKSAQELLREQALSTVMAINYKATLRNTASKYSSHGSSKSLGTVSKGTNVTILYRTINSRSKVRLPNGEICYIKSSNLNVKSNIYKANAYSNDLAEAFVNAKGYTSPTNYLVWLSTYTQRVFIFKGSKNKWDLVRSAPCASGKTSTPTPHGHYEVEYKDSRWYYGGGYHVNKPVTFTIPKNYPHGNAFHSRIYWNNGSLKDGTMSRPASNGCPRMPDSDISYLYNNVKLNSRVISF